MRGWEGQRERMRRWSREKERGIGARDVGEKERWEVEVRERERGLVTGRESHGERGRERESLSV